MEGIKSIIQSKSKQFFIFSLSFLLGVACISITDWQIDMIWFVTSVIVLIVFFIIYIRNITFRFFIICIICVVLGIFRFQLSTPKDGQNFIYNHAGKKVYIIGIVSAEPDVRMDGVRYIVSVKNILEKNKDVDIRGNIYVSYQLHPQFTYGDRLKLRCRLRTPEPIEDFRYDKYLARYGVHVICGDPYIEKLSENAGNPLLTSIFSLKRVVATKIRQLWHEPMASFMAGLLYGYRGGLGTLNELFSRTGVTHIVAISGYNITIIAMILMTLTKYLYIPRKRAFYMIVCGIALFVLFAGASASVVRAGIMGVIVLVSKQMGRSSRISNVMILTAVLMTIQNPYILMYDAGFQLSFISTLGLVYLTPLLETYTKKIPEIFGIKESLVSTIAAIVATLPLILFQFGRLSIVAPIVNVLILWIIPWIMIVGFFAVVASFIFFPLAQIISWIAWIGMKYIVVVVTFFARLDFADVDMTISWYMMIGLYISMVYWIHKKQIKHVVVCT